MKTIIIITHRQGFEADPVIDALKESGIKTFRFNCDSGPTSSGISIEISGLGTSILLSCDGRNIPASELSTGWCQQLPPFMGQPTSSEQCLQNENLLATYLGMFDRLPVRWLNKPSSVIRASNKIIQLDEAVEIGMPIMKTLVSNLPGDIRLMAKSERIIAKNVATPWLIEGTASRAAYTKILRAEWLEDDSDLSFCPIIYQTYCARRFDYRVVVVGSKTFAVRCAPSERQAEDIRLAATTGDSFEACDFDASLIEKLKLLMSKLNLQYCAADFMEDKDGNIYFLEINTCGAWWWVDKLHGGAIRDAIVSRIMELSSD